MMVAVYMYVHKQKTKFVISFFFFSGTWRGSFGLAPFFYYILRKTTLDNQGHHVVTFWICEYVVQMLRLTTSCAVGRTVSRRRPRASYFCPSGLLYTGVALCLKTRKLISYFLQFLLIKKMKF